MKNISILVLAMVSVVVACSIDTQATVIMDWVIVGDPGNAGELSGSGAGGFGPDRICGAVNYTYQIGKYEVTGYSGQPPIFGRFINRFNAIKREQGRYPQKISCYVAIHPS